MTRWGMVHTYISNSAHEIESLELNIHHKKATSQIIHVHSMLYIGHTMEIYIIKSRSHLSRLRLTSSPTVT